MPSGVKFSQGAIADAALKIVREAEASDLGSVQAETGEMLTKGCRSLLAGLRRSGEAAA